MRTLLFALGLAALPALGCSSGGGTQGVLASGRASLDGQPLACGEVILAAEQGGVVRQGTIDKDGRFQVPDIPPGKYKAALRVDVHGEDDYDVGERGKKTLKKTAKALNVPARLQDPATSGVTTEVASGQEIVLDFSSK